MPRGDICSIGNIQEHLTGKGWLEAAKFERIGVGQFPQRVEEQNGHLIVKLACRHSVSRPAESVAWISSL
jgi:hypothetical protein